MAHVMTFNNVEESVMNELKASGCYELFIGIESGSPKILGEINKTKSIDTIIRNLTKVFKAGINMKGYFIYGFPGETSEDMEMTFQLSLKLKELSISYGLPSEPVFFSIDLITALKYTTTLNKKAIISK